MPRNLNMWHNKGVLLYFYSKQGYTQAYCAALLFPFFLLTFFFLLKVLCDYTVLPAYQLSAAIVIITAAVAYELLPLAKAVGIFHCQRPCQLSYTSCNEQHQHQYKVRITIYFIICVSAFITIPSSQLTAKPSAECSLGNSWSRSLLRWTLTATVRACWWCTALTEVINSIWDSDRKPCTGGSSKNGIFRVYTVKNGLWFTKGPVPETGTFVTC